MQKNNIIALKEKKLAISLKRADIEVLCIWDTTETIAKLSKIFLFISNYKSIVRQRKKIKTAIISYFLKTKKYLYSFIYTYIYISLKGKWFSRKKDKNIANYNTKEKLNRFNSSRKEGTAFLVIIHRISQLLFGRTIVWLNLYFLLWLFTRGKLAICNKSL